jgi:UDP-N-acetyl-D-glucosamine dehydrogenase
MTLMQKIKEKSAIVGVVGLGYVGLPMAVTVARKGFKVIGVDVSEYAVSHTNSGDNYIGDVDDDELRELVLDKKMLSASLDYAELKDADVIMVAVPTPLDKYQQPDSSYVRASVKSLAENISKDTLVILESTTYPGTTREIVAPAFEEKGFKVGEDVFVAFSPERVDPGNETYKTNNTPKVVGSMTEAGNELSKVFYNQILDAPIHLVPNPEIAELEKIYENTFRNINIALANEMTILCERMGIDIWDVIEAAKTKPYGFMAFYPGPGIGGHCIPLDPFYLTWKAREYGYHTRLIELAGEINNSMPEFVVQKSQKLLNKKGIAISRAKVLIMGAAYKKDIADMRESPVENLMVHLEEYDANFEYFDPHVPVFHNELNDKHYNSIENPDYSSYDLIIIATAHKVFDYKSVVESGTIVLDTRNACKDFKAENLFRI